MACPDCGGTDSLGIPIEDTIDALIQLGKAQCELLTGIEKRLLTLARGLQKIQDELNRMVSDDDDIDEGPLISN